MKIQFEREVKILKNENMVIIINDATGLYIKLSSVVFDIVLYASKMQWDSLQLYEQLYDDEDRDYMVKVIDRLKEFELIKSHKKKEEKNNKTVIFEITNKCNLHCAHCYTSSGPTGEDILTLNEIKKALTNILKWKPSQISISGGEPMIRKDFIAILKFLHESYDGRIVLLTNGTLIDKNNVQSLMKYVNEINISVDGIDEETCEKVRGKGVFSEVINAVELLQSYGYREIALSMISDRFHRKKDLEFEKLNERLHTTPVIRSFTPEGRGKENQDLLENDNYYAETPYIYKEDFIPCTCTAGSEKILIDHRGNIYPCQYFKENKYLMGNILTSGVSDVIRNYRISIIQEFFPHNHEYCSECSVNTFCWPCPGELKLYSDEAFSEQFDELCNFYKPILKKRIWEEGV